MSISTIILLFIVPSIIFGALGNGYNDSDKKELGYLFSFLSVLGLVLMPVFFHIEKCDIVKYVLGYAFVSFGIYDVVYNLVRHFHLDYVGNTSFIDKFLKLFKVDDSHFMFLRFISLIVGVTLILRIL